MILTAVEAVEKLADIHEQEAQVVSKYDPQAAETIRRLSRDYLEAVRAEVPEWVSLPHVAARTGWSQRHLRNLASDELAPQGLARQRGRSHRWEIHRDAVDRIPLKGKVAGEIPMDDIAATARALGHED